ncbi:zeta toxin family protein [Sphingomonas cavernae]|uniref:zeta toxin family protein n=1 Tax=Sphingomonas cavernae TaxID=2320861 RepID=UPI002368DF09|nr:zeta toxin family protein [Sphingomonas cavernae]
MDRDPERYSLSPDILQRIYETEVAPELFKVAHSVERPTAIVLGGQPGAGKTPMQNLAAREFADKGGIVKIIR